MMAKRKGRRGRKFRRYIRGAIDRTITATTLGAATLVGVDNADTVTERTYVSSVVIQWGMRDYTPILDVGPMIVGIAHSDYSDAEVEAWLENTTAWSEGDLVSQEVGKRKCRIVGQFEVDSAEAVATNHVLNDGKPLKTKCGWVLNTGQTLRYWVYNKGSQAVATTAPDITMVGHANLWPL